MLSLFFFRIGIFPFLYHRHLCVMYANGSLPAVSVTQTRRM